MASCKDCIHYELCEPLCRNMYENGECDCCYINFCGFKSNVKKCLYFKDKSKIVELPCDIGDTVWYICQHNTISLEKDKIYKATVVRFSIAKYKDIGTVVCAVIQIKDKYGTTEVTDVIDFGKTVFLSPEEAEKSLKRRDK